MYHKFTKYYFLGIGGIGMSAIARYYKMLGYEVAGYDRMQTKLTNTLMSEGIAVSFEEDVANIPVEFLDAAKTLVVLTPAVPEDHPQLIYFRKHDFRIMKRAELLGEITRLKKGICIAGTHGKTTTSTITAHLFRQSHVDCSAFLGGISNNYQTNLLVSKESNFVVIEADEYDRSFHTLRPYMAVITSADPDHLDIYKTPDAFKESFEKFASLVATGGALIIKKGVDLQPELQQGVKLYTYSMDEGGDFHAERIRIKPHEIYFDFHTPTEVIADVKLGVPIKINVENSVAAMALAWLGGVKAEELRAGLASFSGVYRRFNILCQSDTMVYIDDYAHHPNELEASIISIREMYPDKKITGIFQPHLYTRTRDFADEFARVLSALDELILTDIYPARELPIDGVDPDLILNKMTLDKKQYCPKSKLISLLEQRDDLELVVSFGAGDIEALVPAIKDTLKSKIKEIKN
ncbi:MAG TPA: UDP-N-acetylmuramate--L-alanine ligase [Paludibacter sp.]|nr:UDP-N-acetylmuramate--L-alanine ligase [Paludibacter sp.]